MPQEDSRSRRFAPWALRADVVLLALTGTALSVGGGLWLAQDGASDTAWMAGILLAAIPAVYWVFDGLRHGRWGVDVIAVLALAGTAAVGEYFAGALIGLMLATGRTLDARAERRATRDLRALLERAPRFARIRTDEGVRTIPIADLRSGQILVVGPGEVVATDGTVQDGPAVLDESALTGESDLIERVAGETVRSGVVNAGPAFTTRATVPVERSTYAGIVRLARAASAQKAPVVRLADRLAAWFLPVTLATAGTAGALTGSAARAVAVLVVATPCPLLLAAPVAIVSGLSRAARMGIVVRDGGALENLGRVRTLMMDKTGTVTVGRPSVFETATAPGIDVDTVLRLAASVDQVSLHVLAEAIVRAARERGLTLAVADHVTETPGRGVTGKVAGRAVHVGTRPAGEDPQWARDARNRAALEGAAIAWVSVDAGLIGAILLRDRLRTDAPRTVRRLRRAGLVRLVLLTGDRTEPARDVAVMLGLDGVLSRQTPADKVEAVRNETARAPTVMVGDGINDAPALAAATVGVAMGARGSSASSEAADVIVTTDRLERLADAMVLARRSRHLAVQSGVVGMSLSFAAMAIAAVGTLPAAPGALVQEAIDIAVIANALRAVLPGRGERIRLPSQTLRMLTRFSGEHDRLRDSLPMIRRTADLLHGGVSPDSLAALRKVYAFLTAELLPHELAEESQLYPALSGPLGSAEAMSPMSRTHAEIQRLIHRLGHHVEASRSGVLAPAEIDDALACLYGLHTLLLLHFAQEEETYFVLGPDTARAGT